MSQSPKESKTYSKESLQTNSKKLTTHDIIILPSKVEKIKEEMDNLDPDTLLLKVDPSIDSTKTIEQIQRYHFLINKELQKFYHQEKQKLELTKNNSELNKSIEYIIKPNQRRKRKEKSQSENGIETNINPKNKSNSLPKKENKPLIDYKTKIRSLEKDIVYKYQDFNHTKSKNIKLMEDLDELRKQVINKTSKLEELKKKLEQQEKSYYAQKAEIEKDFDNKEETELLYQIKQNQMLLEQTNLEMIEKIKETDQFYTQKQAKQKSLDYEAIQLEDKAKRIEERHQREIDNFNKKYKHDIEKVNNFDESSKIIDMLDKDKISNLEEILKEMFNETRTENIQSFVDYFIKSCEEYKTFQDSLNTLAKKVFTVEQEVDELEYIINFCQQNLNVVNDNTLDIEEQNEINILKKCAEDFIEIQYNTINDAYKVFYNDLVQILNKYKPEDQESEERKNNFLEIYIEYLNSSQEEFKKIGYGNKRKVIPKQPFKDIFDFNKWDSKWDKIDKIKETIRKDYEKNGPGHTKFEFRVIKELVDDIMLKGEKK